MRLKRRRRIPRRRKLISQRPTVAKKLLARRGKPRPKHRKKTRRRLRRARGKAPVSGRSGVLQPRRTSRRRLLQRKRRAQRSNPCFCGAFVLFCVRCLLLENFTGLGAFHAIVSSMFALYQVQICSKIGGDCSYLHTYASYTVAMLRTSSDLLVLN